MEQLLKTPEMKFYIKNMVCNRCIQAVKSELEKLNITYLSVKVGHVVIKNALTPLQRLKLSEGLQNYGLEIVDDRKKVMIEKLKRLIDTLEMDTQDNVNPSYSDYISLTLDDSFSSLNQLFSEIEGITIEKYIINHKIDQIKELLVFNNLNLAEIADKMHYRTVAGLSNQFKSVTGLTPAHFRQLQYFSNFEIDVN